MGERRMWRSAPRQASEFPRHEILWLWRINGEMRHFEAVYRVRISSAYDIMQRDMLERQYLSEKHRKLASLAR